ncbi:MAG: hypothetical protein IPK28_06835 [Devosia sp.]|nr:hypothetical protein [Devosia sp.]
MLQDRIDIYRAGEAWLIKSGQELFGSYQSQDSAITYVTEALKRQERLKQAAIYLWDNAFPVLLRI